MPRTILKKDHDMTTFTRTAPQADDSIASFFHAAAISLAGVLALLTVASTL